MKHELARLYGQKVADARMVRWAMHVAKIFWTTKPANTVFASNPVGIRRHGAQRGRWFDQVQQDLKSVGENRSWKNTAKDRVNWRDINNEALSNWLM